MTVQKTISTRAWGEMLLLAAVWGASFAAIRVALDALGPLTVVAHRVCWATVVLWAVVWWMRLAVPRDPKVWFAFLVMGLLNNAVPFGLMAWGQLHIPSGLTAILNAATAIFGVLMAALFFADERLTPRKLIGVMLGFAGVTTAIGLENLRNFDLRALAQLAVIAGTISYALASVWARKRLGAQPPQVAAAGMLTGGSVILLPLAWAVEGPLTMDLTLRTWGALGFVGIISTAFAYLLYYRVLAMAGSGNLMLVTLLIPPFAITLGTWMLGETLYTAAFAGFALLVTGMIILDGRIWRLWAKRAR